MNRIVRQAKNDIVYLVAQDDIIAKDSLARTHAAFFLDKDIGAVTRGYFWFDEDIKKPIRLKRPVDESKDVVVSISDNPDKVIGIFKTIDNITGLAFRRKYLTTPFHKDMFTTHIHPFASIFKTHRVVCLKDYIFACRTKTSQSRQSFSYVKSPMKSWIDMFNTIFPEKKFSKLRKYCIHDFVALNYTGLIQIRNYAQYKDLIREIFLLLKYRWQNIFSPLFWLFSLGCLLIPRSWLINLVDWCKNNINSRILPRIEFHYSI